MISIKKLGFIAVVLFMVLSLYPSGALMADSGPVITIKAANQGSNVILEVKGQRLTDLYAYQFNLAYDTKRLKFIEAKSPVSGFTVDPILKDNDLLFAHSKVGNVKGIQGEASLAVLTFERLISHSGPAEFKLHHIKLVDSGLEMAELKNEVRAITAQSITFTDIKGHWAETSILKASELGWVNGYSDQTFRPQKQVTRAEFVTMLVRALELPVSEAPELQFKDSRNIPVWSKGYIQTAVESGLIEGYADGTFRHNRLITRAEMAAVIVRSQGVVPDPAAKPKFSDTEQIPAWAQPYIASAVDRGWIQGIGRNQFAPLKNANRAEAVHLILAIDPSLSGVKEVGD
ncbi:S-layer homology domain-containing protein [Paenibacillus lemnae]|uniref:SLH domain-containing protein n=1 Tax=Paenibacillus lemnae TaxID=1330551 RepID=A0A848M3E6_PAELE|nr:S-layer homology domain-containing protein [Paenibacillus lemnae]NMO95457.1 hypothetical protein [Paenibacillus lemnae]